MDDAFGPLFHHCQHYLEENWTNFFPPRHFELKYIANLKSAQKFADLSLISASIIGFYNLPMDQFKIVIIGCDPCTGQVSRVSSIAIAAYCYMKDDGWIPGNELMIWEMYIMYMYLYILITESIRGWYLTWNIFIVIAILRKYIAEHTSEYL